jgi:hypothetical protein
MGKMIIEDWSTEFVDGAGDTAEGVIEDLSEATSRRIIAGRGSTSGRGTSGRGASTGNSTAAPIRNAGASATRLRARGWAPGSGGREGDGGSGEESEENSEGLHIDYVAEWR